MIILYPEQLDTIFKQEIAKYRYKPNWEFFANPYFWLRFRGGYGFRITEQPNTRQPPIIRNIAREFNLESLQYLTPDQVREHLKRCIYDDIRQFEMVQFQSHLAYDNELISPPIMDNHGT
jgi:hypothetical protein